MGNRRSVKLHPRVKFRLELAKNIMGVKSESDAISYLLHLYTLMDESEKISTRMHDNIMKKVSKFRHHDQQEEEQ